MNRLVTFGPALALLAGVILISGAREQHQMPAVQPMNAIPATFDGVTGSDLKVPEDQRKIAAMSDYMQRLYGKDTLNWNYQVFVAYYDRQVQGKAIHSPRNCLPGGGWEIMSSQRIPVPSGGPGTVNRVIIGNAGVRALVYYWYQGRGRVESNEYRVKWNLLRDAALYGRTEEALVRIIVPIAPPAVAGTMPSADDAEVAAADATARRVATELAQRVSRVLPPPPGA
jgi:EpsI family protein